MGPKNIKSQPSLRGRGVSDTDRQPDLTIAFVFRGLF